MPFDAVSLLGRDMMITTALVGAAAVATYYYKSSRRAKRSPTVVAAGKVPVQPQLEHVQEYERDFERFLHSGSVFSVPQDRKRPIVLHEASDVLKFNPFKGTPQSGLFYYGVSASLCLDVVQFLKISPPVVHQPVVVVDSEGMTVAGFVGESVKGDRPDRKHTTEGIVLNWKFEKYSECMYQVFRCKKNVSRSIDLLGLMGMSS